MTVYLNIKYAVMIYGFGNDLNECWNIALVYTRVSELSLFWG